MQPLSNDAARRPLYINEELAIVAIFHNITLKSPILPQNGPKGPQATPVM